MLELGLFLRINASSSPPTIEGGFATELPKDFVVTDPVWFYVMVGGSSESGLLFYKGLIRRHVEIHSAAPTQELANEFPSR